MGERRRDVGVEQPQRRVPQGVPARVTGVCDCQPDRVGPRVQMELLDTGQVPEGEMEVELLGLVTVGPGTGCPSPHGREPAGAVAPDDDRVDGGGSRSA